jgi:hypothetical protein
MVEDQMQHHDRILLGATSVDVDALVAIDAGKRVITAREADELRAKGWLDPNCEVPLITIAGRVLLERTLVKELLASNLR